MPYTGPRIAVYMLVRARGLAYLSMTVQDRTHFVYGSLMDKNVLTTLMGRVPELIPGTLHGYRRYRVPNQGEKRLIPPECNTYFAFLDVPTVSGYVLLYLWRMMAVYPGILPDEETSSVNGLLVKGLRESEVVSDLPLLPWRKSSNACARFLTFKSSWLPSRRFSTHLRETTM